MAQIVINVPDDKEQRFINAFADVYGWYPELPETKRQFMKAKIKDFMKQVLFKSEILITERRAKEALQTDIDTIDVS